MSENAETKKIPDDVDNSVVRQADRQLRRWLRGEVDAVYLATTAEGRRVIEGYHSDS